MGICTSSPIKGGNGRLIGSINWPTVKVIHFDGRLQEFKQPIKVKEILSQNPNCFLCNSENMDLNSYIPHMDETEELQLGPIYFLMPLSRSRNPLTLSELCSLAIKASSLLPQYQIDLSSIKFHGGKNVINTSRRSRRLKVLA